MQQSHQDRHPSTNSLSVIKSRMDNIIREIYPGALELCQKIASVAEEFEPSTKIERIKGLVDVIYNALERQYYKEKIVLFPFLEQTMSGSHSDRLNASIKSAQDEVLRIAGQVRHLCSWLAELSSAVGDKSEATEAIIERFRVFDAKWQELNKERDELYVAITTLS
ncbi:MAG TPA: hypothetical protein VKZ76_07320 [Edaphocola sp.]|nr:hypothetical protein [Edaphocola sp.]